MVAFKVLLLVLMATNCRGYKIVMFPYGNRSHLIQFHGLGRVLLERGHEVHIYLSEVDTPPTEIATAGYKFIHPNLNMTMMHLMASDQEMIERSELSLIRNIIELRPALKKFNEVITYIGNTIINDEPTLEAMKKENFDFAIVDSYKPLSFVFLLPRKLGIPYGGLTTVHDPFTNRVPHFPSAFVDIMYSTAFGVKADELGSSFIMRLKNFVAVAVHEYFGSGWADDVFKAENTTLAQINEDLALNFVDLHYVLDEPIPTIPNVLMVGGLVTRPPRPITDAKLLHFIEDTSHPVIVCSFGTMITSLTPEIMRKLFDAFRLLPQYRIVMRLKNTKNTRHSDAVADVITPPDNLLILDWLPQNDLLAHNKTALLITHSGNNGQNEAVYHGIPMVAFYIFGDQLNNAERVERRGYGVKLNLLAFEHTELVQAVERVLTNEKYRQNIKKASEIFRQPSAGDVAADAIENVIKFGSDHLRPHEALSMSVFEFTMLDIVFLTFTLLTCLAYLLFKLTIRVLKKVYYVELTFLDIVLLTTVVVLVLFKVVFTYVKWVLGKF